MKKLIYAFLAAIMAAASTPALAQKIVTGYVTDYNSVRWEDDFILDNGTRMISATSFLVYESEKVQATAYVFVFIPKGKVRDTESWQWLVAPQISYRSRTGWYGDIDTSTEFVRGDVLVLMDGMDGPKFEMECVSSLMDRSGEGRACGAFKFDFETVNSYLKAVSPDRIYYTQGTESSGIFPALTLRSPQNFVLPLLKSCNVIMQRVIDTL